MLFLVCFTRLVMRCFLCRPGLLLSECLTVCRSPLCCMNTRPLGRGCTTLGCWWGAGCPAVSGTGILAADWLVPLRMSGGASVDFVHLTGRMCQSHAYVSLWPIAVVDSCLLQ